MPETIADAQIDPTRKQIVIAVFDEGRGKPASPFSRRSLWISFEQARQLAPRLESCVGKISQAADEVAS